MNCKVSERGFTYVEALVGLMILAMALAPLIIAFPTGAMEARLSRELSTASTLGEDLMDEIMSKRFDETPRPGNTTPPSALGPDGGESTGIRRVFDDVDDYHGWTEDPVEDMDGNVMEGFTGFTRSVVVEYVKLAGSSWEPVVPGDKQRDFKRVTVTVRGRYNPDVVFSVLAGNF